MNAEQSRMARAALNWSLTELAERSGLGRATLARFELGQTVTPETIAAIRKTFEAARVRIIDKGPFKGGVTRVSAS